MPALIPIWSDGFTATSKWAKRTGIASNNNFMREFELFQRWWGTQKRPDPANYVKGTRKNPVPATQEQEFNELLIHALSTSCEKARLLLSAGASPNSVGLHTQKHALQWVAERRSPELMKEFLEMGADMHVAAKTMSNSMMNKNASFEMVKVLVEAGVEVDGPRDYQGRNALGFAAYMGRSDIVQYLVANGANINLQCNTRRAAVHHVTCAHPECAAAGTVEVPLGSIEPRRFITCNTDIMETLVSLGADLTLSCTRDRACVNGMRIHAEHIERVRRLAFTMALHDRLGAGSVVHGMDLELVRMILEEAGR
ncbi:ankyrin repeat-containing domain protein [Baffinella frigidus]|jgi:hypothetical protein|nr:ankyrin repeat-containing domain protein [Cryptophyta sp. CCMP2293]KAJ1468285.1 ankyrin repeat-containing domain protein [Cryptophyta sp. CCMP2293]